jgi:ankyrin repeat protein
MANDNKKKSNPTTAAALSAVGSSIIPEKAQSLLDNDNKDTLDLSAKNGKTELIEELKARNADSYPKVQSGPNQGNPTGAVNIPMLTSLLKAANDDRNIVVRKAAGASAPAVPEWRR